MMRATSLLSKSKGRSVHAAGWRECCRCDVIVRAPCGSRHCPGGSPEFLVPRRRFSLVQVGNVMSASCVCNPDVIILQPRRDNRDKRQARGAREKRSTSIPQSTLSMHVEGQPHIRCPHRAPCRPSRPSLVPPPLSLRRSTPTRPRLLSMRARTRADTAAAASQMRSA